MGALEEVISSSQLIIGSSELSDEWSNLKAWLARLRTPSYFLTYCVLIKVHEFRALSHHLEASSFK